MGSFFLIRKNLIGLVDLLEFFFIASAFIGMILVGHLIISPLNFFGRGILFNAESLVVVFCHLFLFFILTLFWFCAVIFWRFLLAGFAQIGFDLLNYLGKFCGFIFYVIHIIAFFSFL